MVYFIATVSYFEKWNMWIPLNIVFNNMFIYDNTDLDKSKLSRKKQSIQYVWQPGRRPKLLFPAIIMTSILKISQRRIKRRVNQNIHRINKFKIIKNLFRREIES